MSKILKRIIVGISVAVCLAGVVVTTIPAISASAATINYDILREQNIYVNDQFATIQVNVDKNTFEQYGVKAEIYKELSYEQDFQSLKYAGVKYYNGGNKVESVYNYNTGKYEVTFTIYKNTIEENSRAYFHIVNNNENLYEDINGGYGYQLW